MIKIIIMNIVLLLLYTGCGGSSEPKKNPPSGNPGTGDGNEPTKTTRSIYSFTIYTKSGSESEANATANINNFHLTIQRAATILFDSNSDNDSYSVHSNQDSSISVSSKSMLKVGDILTLNADGFTPQQQSIDSAMLEANGMRIALKPIGSRQVFELGALNEGRVTTRFAMGASTKINGENIEFKTNDNAVVLNIKKSQIERIAKRVSRSTKADKNTEIYLDITTVDPKTEYESAIGDFTYSPDKEPRSARSTRAVSQADTMLESVVMASISMTTSEGEEIHCFDGSAYDENSGTCSGDGSTATLKMKIPSSQFDQYADKYNKGERTIPLYHYSTTKATWIRQVKDGNAVDGELVLEDLNTNGIADEGDTLYLSGEVGHFSYWNGDMPRETVKLNGAIQVENGAKIPNGTVVVSKGADYTGRSFRVQTSNLSYSELGAKKDAKVELYLQYPDGTKSESIFVQTATDNQQVSEVLVCAYELQEITLTVKDLNGNPLDGATVQGAGSSSSTDSNGHVDIEVSKNASTKVTASYDTGVFTTSSAKFVNVDDTTIVLDTRSFKISGAVNFQDENGNAIDFQNGYVDIYDYESGLYNRVYVENGTYELLLPFNKLRSGKTVNMSAGIFVPLYAKFIDKEQSITISDVNMQAKSKTFDFTFTLQPFIVSGKVSNPFARSAQNGIANITVYSDSQSVQSDEEGNYQMLLFYKEGGQTLRAYDPINGDIVRPTVINIAEDEQDQDHNNQNFIIDRRSANIEGSVINERGIPVQGVLVYTSYGWLSTVTDEEGKFSFEINDASMMGRGDIMLYVYDANDNTKRLGTHSVDGTLQRGKTIEAGEISISTNIAPIIKSVTWDEPILGQPMNIYIDAYDPDNNQLKTTITFDGSEITVTQGIATITPPETGRLEFTTKVEEIDGEGLSAEVTQSMIVSENAKPVVSSITGFVKEYKKASDMIITIQASDPEGATLGYRARLFDTYGREADFISVTGNQVTIQNSIANGRYRLTVYISDGIDEIERNFTFVADDNVAPENLSISKDGDNIEKMVYATDGETTFELVANATDANGDTLTYTWSLNEALGTVSGNTLSINPSGKVGIFPITVSVTDGTTYISKEITLVIENNLKPIISSITLNPQTLTKVGDEIQDAQGTPVTELSVQVSATDPEVTALSYNFGDIVSTLSELGFGSTNSKTYDISALSVGRHAFRVDVKDEAGKTTSQRVLFEILENKPPRITSFFVPIKAKAGETVQLRASAIDPEGKDITYSWSATHNGTALTLGDANTLSIDNLTGEIIVQLEVSDGSNKVTRERTIEIVENHAPVINQFRVLPTSLKVGNSVQFSALASDPDLDDITYNWYWNNELISEEANGVKDIPTDADAGEYELKLVVSDDELSATQTQSIQVEQLEAKPVVTLQASKSQILVGAQTEITATVSIASRLRWRVSEGGEIIPKTGGVTFSAVQPGTYTVSVVATNEDDIQSDEATIEIEVKTLTLTLSSQDAIQPIGSEFTIDANLSDEGFSIPADASWQVTAKPENAQAVLHVDGTTATVTPDIVGTYTISLSFEIDGVAFNATQTIVANDDVINEENTVHGVVTGINGEILEGAQVRLYNADDSSLYDVTQTTDETGNYIFSELEAGRYYLVVSGGDGYINQTQVIIIN